MYLGQRGLQQHFDEAHALNDGLIVICPKQAKHDSQGVTPHYLLVELQGKDLHESDAEIGELVSVHAEIDQGIK